MGLVIQALDSSKEEVLKELEYDYISYENLRINLLKTLNIPFQIYKYQPTMNLIVLCFDKGTLKNEYQEAFVLLTQPFYIGQTLTNHTLRTIFNYINNSDYEKSSHTKAVNASMIFWNIRLITNVNGISINDPRPL